MAILTCDYLSDARNAIVSFTAILPIDAPAAGSAVVQYTNGPYPTIYLLHGYTGNRNDWLVRSRIEEWAMARGFAVIMPDGGNRFYIDDEQTKELNGVFIGEELVDFTRRIFPLSNKREDTTIAGLSMGGYGSLRNGLHYADTFGSIIALSSALIIDEIASMLPGDSNIVADYSYYRHTFGELKKLPGSHKDPKYLAKARIESGDPMPRLFLACGTEDFLYPQNCDYHDYLSLIGYPHNWWIQPGAHDFDFWNMAMPAGMDWLLHTYAPNSSDINIT